MKVSKPFIIALPSHFVDDLTRCLKENPPSFKYDKMNFYYIIYYLATCMLTSKKDAEYIKISMKRWRSTIHYDASKYLQYCKSCEFIITDKKDEKFKKHTETIGYKIADKYISLESITEIEIMPDTKVYKKLHSKYVNRKAHYNKLEHHLKKMKDEFYKVELDYQKAIQYVLTDKKNYVKAIYHLTAIYNFKDKRLRSFKPTRNGLLLMNKSRKGKTNNGRLNTNLTTLWKELKQFIIDDYVCIDAVNSQPFLLSILIKSLYPQYNHNATNTIMMEIINKKSHQVFGKHNVQRFVKNNHNYKNAKPVSLSFFEEVTLKGVFYEEWQKHLPNELLQDIEEGKIRSKLKDITFHTLYSKTGSNQKQKKLFKEPFPEVLEIVEALKTKGNSLLPVLLQQIESYIFIDIIAKRLVESDIIPMTIHDSVIVPKKHQEQALKIIKDAFKEIVGVIPKFHIEAL